MSPLTEAQWPLHRETRTHKLSLSHSLSYTHTNNTHTNNTHTHTHTHVYFSGAALHCETAIRSYSMYLLYCTNVLTLLALLGACATPRKPGTLRRGPQGIPNHPDDERRPRSSIYLLFQYKSTNTDAEGASIAVAPTPPTTPPTPNVPAAPIAAPMQAKAAIASAPPPPPPPPPPPQLKAGQPPPAPSAAAV
jgi:hypothetical protein